MEFSYDGGGLGKGGAAVLYVDGAKAGEGRVEGTMPLIFSDVDDPDHLISPEERFRVAMARQ
jgi:hypothetical protein